jgi:CPA1 family monovalent cation:H+ antiporter
MEIPQISSQILLLCGVALTGIILARLMRLPFALICVLVGFAFGQLLPWLQLDTGIRASNFSDIIFFALLPPLIFEAGWHIDPARLRHWLPMILTLAIVGLLIATLVGASLLFLGFNHPVGFPFIAALLTACLLAATDPVTVIQQLRSAHAPADLAVVIEGESLFNDATAIVLFSAILSYALAIGDNSAGPGMATIISFGVKFGGGLVCGAIAGVITTLLLRLAPERASVNLTLVLSAFATFCASETLFHVSGIVAVLICALLCRRLAQLTADTHNSANDTMDWLGLLCNALLFTLMGLAFEPNMLEQRWLAMLLGVFAALIARTLAIYSCLALSRRLFGIELPPAYPPVMIWGGLRGAVTIALALSLPTELPYWWTVQAIAFGVVLFNLFVQGPSNQLLLRWLLKRPAAPEQ